MQDRYSGDVGDFGKFSLLRYLFGDSHDRIGVIWYLFPDESHNDDGRHIDYLTDRGFLACDKRLCDKLSAVVHGNRSVSALEKAGVLAADTVYFADRLNFHIQFPSQKQETRRERKEKRRQWLERAVLKVSNCNVVFLDPDNGLQIPSCSKTSQLRSGKFAYYSEISELTKGKDVTVIYHHLGRNGSHADQIRAKTAELRKRIDPSGTIFALRYRPYSPRAYFILTAKSESIRIKDRLQSFIRSSYGAYWDSYYEERPSPLAYR
jgi:hypothetical protein